MEVAGAPVDGVEIRMEATAELRGRIAGLEPAELAWARVWAQTADSPNVFPAQVAADGSYRITRGFRLKAPPSSTPSWSWTAPSACSIWTRASGR